ncbi:hypothetical protein PLICRDRAFT_700042 [Plicaturopsis crispa FD-325 SS-3]|nr:hypothetical protein PLICRDRAFT_700042 [Plicaturopsis crispa FD-325 SS-3]
MTGVGHAEISSILGWVSIACWIVVYSPQILKNYQLKNGDGLSVPFIFIWLLGDLADLVGALLAGLLPTVIILAVYYSVCDIILLAQIYLYRWRKRPTQNTPATDNHEHAARPAIDTVQPGEATPLLSTIYDAQKQSPDVNANAKIVAQYLAGFMFVTVAGVLAWLLSANTEPPHTDHPHASEWVIQIIGWASAVLELGARIPQISKNFRTRCEGLSPALFIFTITGNATYAASICFASTEREYLIRNSSWLAGSGLTIFFDVFVLCQFVYYRPATRHVVHHPRIIP